MQMHKSYMLSVVLAVAATSIPPLAHAIDDPFADTKFHYQGGGMVTAEGDYVKAGDFPDARFAADASNPLHGSTVVDPSRAFYESYTNDAIRLETVACRYSGITLTNVPCIHFAQQTTEDGNGTPTKIWPTYLGLPELFSVTNQCTVFVRFKCDGFPAKKNLRQTILSLGYNWSANTGYCFGIAGGEASPTLQLYCGKDKTLNFGKTFKTNVWVEAACVVSGKNVATYLDYAPPPTGYENGWFEKKTATLSSDVDAVTESASRTVFKLGGEQRLWSYNYGQDNYWKQFRGSIHEVAIWDRALTESEVRQAFAGQRGGNSLWRYGAKDGASGEFTGTQDAVPATLIGDWRPLKPSLTAESPSISVSFTLPHTTDATVPKRLVIDSAAASSSSRLAVSVNGTPCGTLAIPSGGAGVCEIPARFWAAADNSVSVTLADGGPFAFDAMRLENVGWQIGYTDKNQAEFVQETDAGKFFRAECVNWKDMNRVLKLGDWRRTLEVHFSLTANDATKGMHTLKWAMWNAGDTAYAKTASLFVNGSSTARAMVAFPASSSAGDLFVTETEFAPGELLDGENVFTFKGGMEDSSASETGWISIDYLRLDTRLDKAMVITFR